MLSTSLQVCLWPNPLRRSIINLQIQNKIPSPWCFWDNCDKRLYYACTNNSTIHVILGITGSQQIKATKNNAVLYLPSLQYLAVHHCDTYLIIYDASHPYWRLVPLLYIWNITCRRICSLSSCSQNSCSKKSPLDYLLPTNIAVHFLSTIMETIRQSATKAKLGALFLAAKDTTAFYKTLDNIGHLQPPTMIIMDNSCAEGIINDVVKQRQLKTIYLRYYCICDRIYQRQFNVQWCPGTDNMSDHFTNHHMHAHHWHVYSQYLLDNPLQHSDQPPPIRGIVWFQG